MIRQRALAWTAVLALVVAIQIASFPIRPTAAIAAPLAQDTPVVKAGQPTDLVVVALHCAAAPVAEGLSAFFATGAAPTGCAPAVGVRIAVMENGAPLSGSPFTTDTAGAFSVRVGLGSSVTLREDLKSLPSGYQPLTQEANGVPYANPVLLDSAAAGTAALFVNVPASVVATLAQGAPASEAVEPTDLAVAVAASRTGCDSAYPDERTCIPSGSPLDAPCAITDERNFTVLPPDPRNLDADGDGIGCEPIFPGSRPNNTGNIVTLSASGDSRPAAPVRNGDLAVASPRRTSDGAWVLPRNRDRADDWLVQRDRSNNGSLAIVSNSVIIGNGLWRWDGHHRDDHDFWRSHITIGNFTIARSSNGSLAIVSNSVFISNGLWSLFGHREDNGFWRNRIVIGNLTIARSSSGSLAIVSNSVFIGNDPWTSGDDHHNDNWLASGGTDRVHAPDGEPRAIDDGLAVESPLNMLAQSSNSEQPTLLLNGALSVALPDDLVAPPSDAAVAAPPSDVAVESPPDAAVAPPSDASVTPPPDDTSVETPPSDVVQPPADAVEAPIPSDNVVEPPSDNAIAPPPSDGTVAPPSDNAAQPPDAVIAPPPDAVVSPPGDGYVEPPPSDIGAPDPGNSDAGNGDFVTTAPDPVNVAPGNGAPGLDIAPSGGDFDNRAPDPVSVAPGNGDFGVDHGMGDSGNAMPNPVDVAPDPIDVGSGNGGSGGDFGDVAPDSAIGERGEDG